ncbi:MAG: MBL fold metallo-hydrolase, partial [Dehalococcoidia bacterium]|nr:MBL fold metallo-hydrolase [Dehalococcoidia bacterium]
MKVIWLGHACFLITADNGLKIVIDPYEASPGGRISYGPAREAPDVVTIGHQDAAHNHTADLRGNPEIVQGAGSHMAGGIEFVGIPTPHGPVPTGEPPGALGLEAAVALWEVLPPAVVILRHFRNQKCNFPSCGVEDLVRLRPGAVLVGNTEAELTAGHLPEGRILVLEPA